MDLPSLKSGEAKNISKMSESQNHQTREIREQNVELLMRLRRLLQRVESSRTVTSSDHRERRILIEQIDEILLRL